MDIQTKYKTGDKVWFYNMGEINQAKIIHIDIDVNGGINITYILDRKDKQYKDAHYEHSLSYLRYCSNCSERESAEETCFKEDRLAATKTEMIDMLINEELSRHNNELKTIRNLQ